MLPSSFFTSILIHSRRPIRIGRAVSTLQNVISIEPQRRPDQIPHQQRRGDHQRTHHQPQTALHDRNLHNTQSRWNIACLLHKIFRRPFPVPQAPIPLLENHSDDAQSENKAKVV